jgi:hypothetical protein
MSPGFAQTKSLAEAGQKKRNKPHPNIVNIPMLSAFRAFS